MKLLEASAGAFRFQLSRQEKILLTELLKLYPALPASYHRLTKSADAAASEHQQLLEEALAAQKRAGKEQLLALLSDPQRFQENETGHRLTLDAPQVEGLLQALNEVRVGSWVQLGSPTPESHPPIELSAQTVRHYAVMELCGLFEGVLLGAVDGGS